MNESDIFIMKTLRLTCVTKVSTFVSGKLDPPFHTSGVIGVAFEKR